MKSMAFRLTLTVGCMVLAATATVSFAGYVSGRSSVELQIRERVAAMTTTTSSQAAAYVAARVEEMRQMSTSALQVKSLSGAARARLLFDYANAFGSNRYIEIAILDGAGRTIAASTGSPSYTARPEVVRALRIATRPGITPLTRFADQQQDVFVVFAPLFDENYHRYGTLAARLPATELIALVRSVPVDASTSLYLTRRGAELAANRGARGPGFGSAGGAFSAWSPIAPVDLGLKSIAAVDPAGALAPVNELALRSALAGALVLLLAWFSTILIARSIARPVRDVAEAATRLARGDLDARVAIGHDVRETAELADAFNAMSGTLRELIVGLAGTSKTIAAAARETFEGANAVRSETEEQARMSVQIATALAAVAGGARAIGDDAALLERSSLDSLTHLGVLLTEVDGTGAAIEQLRESVARSNRAGRALADQAASIAQRALDVAQRANDATASAARGDEAVGRLVTDIRNVGVALGETAGRLDGLAGGTGEAIAAQVRIIDDMAERSKLLALNAAIEAARAGEHGRGFGVIASELHRLASGSKDASTQVKLVVTQVVGEMQSLVLGARDANELAGVAIERAEQTGVTIAGLAAEIAENAANARAIEAISAQQARRTDEIMDASEEIQRTADVAAAGAGSVGELSRRVRDAVELATRIAVQVAAAIRAQRTDFDVIERGANEIGSATAHVAEAAERSVVATDGLRVEIRRIAESVARFSARDEMARAGADASGSIPWSEPRDLVALNRSCDVGLAGS